MKKICLSIAVAAVLLLSPLLGACRTAPQAAPPSESATLAAAVSPSPEATEKPSPSPSSSPVSPSPEVSGPAANTSPEPTPDAPFDFEETAFLQGGITIKYPQIAGNSDKTVQDALNKLIADSALREVPTIKDDESLDVYELSYTVSRNSPEVISVYFDGYASYKQAAHPYQFFYSVTIDVEKLQIVTLPQLVSITPDFLAKLPEGTYRSTGIDMTEDYMAAIRDYLLQSDKEYMLQELRQADSPGQYTSSYLTEDSLGISVVVGHAMGDHIEILFKFSDLTGFQTDNLLWKAIEK